MQFEAGKKADGDREQKKTCFLHQYSFLWNDCVP